MKETGLTHWRMEAPVEEAQGPENAVWKDRAILTLLDPHGLQNGAYYILNV
jgi:hypothetical protein